MGYKILILIMTGLFISTSATANYGGSYSRFFYTVIDKTPINETIYLQSTATLVTAPLSGSPAQRRQIKKSAKRQLAKIAQQMHQSQCLAYKKRSHFYSASPGATSNLTFKHRKNGVHTLNWHGSCAIGYYRIQERQVPAVNAGAISLQVQLRIKFKQNANRYSSRVTKEVFKRISRQCKGNHGAQYVGTEVFPGAINVTHIKGQRYMVSGSGSCYINPTVSHH